MKTIWCPLKDCPCGWKFGEAKPKDEIEAVIREHLKTHSQEEVANALASRAVETW